jgi:hypothetical protein
MYFIETPERVLYDFEAIDIENDEYLFRDSAEASARVSVFQGKVAEITVCDQHMSLREAFQNYAETNGLRVVTGKSPIETWSNYQSQLPPKKAFWQRLIRSSRP